MKKIPGIEFSLSLVFLIILHLGVFPVLLPEVMNSSGKYVYDWSTVSILFAANFFYMMCGFFYSYHQKNFRLTSYLCVWLFLFLLVFVFSQRYLFFILSLFAAGGTYHDRRILVFFFIFLFSVLLFSSYWIPALTLLSTLYFFLLMFTAHSENLFEKVMMAAGMFILFILLFPLVNLIFQFQPQTLIASCNSEMKEALKVSLFTSSISTLVVFVFGVPLAWCMARKDFSAKPAIDALIDLPIIVPQTAAGIAVLVLLGPKTPLGEFFYQHLGISFSGTSLGIIACQIFVSSPFLLRSSISAFQSVDQRLEKAARSLGTSPLETFLRISFPLAAPGIFNGCILTFSRALSEAGSLMIVAYRPSTIPILIDDTFAQYGIREAAPITVLFVIFCLGSFITLKWFYEIRKKAVLAP